ncbi:MAG TPA: glycosyltransferase family 4 protein [Candidatus Limnocylindria bacterium]|nr:glycosyltransferase family 4 protein [Candidatus Limnocylindria bacterium]
MTPDRAPADEAQGAPVSPLFLTRKFPPAVGGMEILAENTWASLRQRFPGARLIANRHGNRMLPLWWLGNVPRVALMLALRRADTVLTGDALAYALFRPVLAIARVPHATMVMGLDVTYDHRLYRALVHPALRRAPRVIAISEATARAAIDVGVDPRRVSVIRLGLPVPALEPRHKTEARQALRSALGVASNEIVALTIGRLVRRKGVLWFVREVMPRLPASVVYVVAGDGPMAAEVKDAAVRLGLTSRVRLLGRVDDETREELLLGADLFVQPNVRVPGDMEGFGLAILEAAMRGTLTVASGIEGIRDAVVDGQTGILLNAEEPGAWVERISALASDVAGLHDLGWTYGRAARDSYGIDAMGEHLARLLHDR